MSIRQPTLWIFALAEMVGQPTALECLPTARTDNMHQRQGLGIETGGLGVSGDWWPVELLELSASI